MSDIKSRIKTLGDHFQEMKVANTDNGDYIYVVLKFPSDWILDEETTATKFNGVNCSVQNGLIVFWAEISTEFETVFDAIDYNVRINKEAQEKAVLFNQKYQELRDIFSDDRYTLEQLKTLTITLSPEGDSPKIPFTIPTTNKRGSKKKDEPIKPETPETND
jgi:hypothetical protein